MKYYKLSDKVGEIAQGYCDEDLEKLKEDHVLYYCSLIRLADVRAVASSLEDIVFAYSGELIDPIALELIPPYDYSAEAYQETVISFQWAHGRIPNWYVPEDALSVPRPQTPIKDKNLGLPDITVTKPKKEKTPATPAQLLRQHIKDAGCIKVPITRTCEKWLQLCDGDEVKAKELANQYILNHGTIE